MVKFPNASARVGPAVSQTTLSPTTVGEYHRLSLVGANQSEMEQQLIRKRMKSRRTMDDENLHLQSARFAEHGLGKSRKREDEQRQKKEEDDYLMNFIRTKFTCKECMYFKPKESLRRDVRSSSSSKPQCECGDFEENHYKPTQTTTSFQKPDLNIKWNAADHIHELKPTNAFGQIEFVNESLGSLQPTEYIRISDTNRVDDILELMTDFWGLLDPQKPSLCISVIGGAKNFKLEGRKKEVFHHGLIKAAQTTGAWLITSGLNLGIIRVVGDALQEGQSFHWGKKNMAQRLRCIGIAPWGYVLNRERLVSLECQGLHPACYKITNVIKSGSPVSLNPNHTHYIFVDEGLRRRYGGCKSGEFRAALERRIAQPEEEGGLGIPVVLVIVEGGYDVFIDAQNSINESVPVVVCDGTGRAADILAFAAKKAKFGGTDKEGRRTLQANHEIEVKDRLQEKFGREFKAGTDKELGKAYSMIAEIVANERLITVFDMNRSNDLDLSILYALLKVQGDKTEENMLQQLKLALTWNRVDIATERIFTEDIAWSESSTGGLDELMAMALVDSKLEFVKLFLHNGVVMREFLTVKRLRALYNASGRESHFRAVMHRVVPHCPTTSQIHLAQVRYLLRKLIQKYHNDIYDRDTPRGLEHVFLELKETMNAHGIEEKLTAEEIEKQLFPQPFNELFIWAVLTKRQTLARFFWERTDEAIPQAIAATWIYRSLSKLLPSYDTESKQIYISWKDEFEMLAVKVVEECGEIDPSKAALLVEKRHNMYGGYNCLQMAAAAVNRKFLSTAVCQNSVNFIWNQGINARIASVFLCLILPPLILWPRLVGFQIPDLQQPSCSVGCRKIITFYRAPKTKFIINAIFTAAFLMFYACFLLFGFQKNIQPMEMVVMGFMIVFVVEEIREMFASNADSVTEKLVDWWHFSSWNKTDLVMVLFGMASVLSRIGGEQQYIVTKTLYVVTGCFFFLRLFRLYSVSPILGPKLVMIKRMVMELLFYLAILLVALLTYGVSSQALLYPLRSFTPQVLVDTLYYPYWQIYGEIYLEEANAEKAGCNGTNLFTADGEPCPSKHWLVLVLLAVYLIIVNVLLLNLLIAIFSNVFTEVQENSLEIWKFEMYFLVVEYEMKPFLPIPFVIIEDIIRFIVFIARAIQSRCNPEEEVLEDLDPALVGFEKDMLKSYIVKVNESALQTTNSRITSITKRLEDLYRLVDEERQFEMQVHHRQHSLQNEVARPPTRTDSVMDSRPATSMPNKQPEEDAKNNVDWPPPNMVTQDLPKKKLEHRKYPSDEKTVETQVEIVRDKRRRDEAAYQFEADMQEAQPGPSDSISRGELTRRSTNESTSFDFEQRNNLSDEQPVVQRLQAFEERTEAMIDSLRSALGEQQRRKDKIGATKRKVNNIEQRLADLEANTGQSLANIESLLRTILTQKGAGVSIPTPMPDVEEEEEDEAGEDISFATRRRF